MMHSNPIFADDDKFHEECGIVAIHNHPEAAKLAGLGLHALQHRGQEACGITSFDGTEFYHKKGLGLVDRTFSSDSDYKNLHGTFAIGHNRYATAGGKAQIANVQPFFAQLSLGGVAIAHNGNLTNAQSLKDKLQDTGTIFTSSSDTEVILHLAAQAKAKTIQDKVIEALQQVEGAFSLVCVSDQGIMGVRDPRGFRPMVLGKLNGSHILTSETCALDVIGAEFVRDVEPGEMVRIDSKGVHSSKPFAAATSHFCIFEYVYFAKPESFLNGKSASEARREIGRQLAKESPCEADVIVPVPSGGNPGAEGYAEVMGIPKREGIIRSHNVGRTFIEPTQDLRINKVRLKLNPDKAVLDGKRVVLVDDSIVRGTTSKQLVEMVRAAGAKEVHLRVAAPPTVNPCYYGIDTPTPKELIANQMNVEAICKDIGADSLAYVSLDGLYRAVTGQDKPKKEGYCDACFTGNYPVAIRDNTSAEPGIV